MADFKFETLLLKNLNGKNRPGFSSKSKKPKA